MRSQLPRLCLAAAGAALYLASVGPASAQTNAYDDASAYTTGWPNGINHGFGFGAWALTNNNGAGGGFAGTFVGGSGSAIDTGGNSLGMYANSGAYNYSSAYRSFSNVLAPGYVFRIKFKNGNIVPGNAVGFSLLTASSPVATNDIATIGTAARLSFYFYGGANNYKVWDGVGGSATDTGIPFTYNGLWLEFALRDADTYRLVVKSGDGNTTLAAFDGLPLRNSGTIDSFVCYNLNAGGGGDAFFNQFQVSSASLVPPVIQNLSPTNGSAYVSSASLFSFDVTSAFSTVSSNGVSLILNGANQTNMSFAGSGTANLTATLNTALQDNLTYNGTIVATDANGNRATNTFTFNTWRSDNPFIEAADYNFSAGGFQNDAFPDLFDLLGVPNTPLLGTNGVDYLDYDTTPVSAYRPGDQPQVEVSGDAVDHAGYVANSYPIYNLGYIKRFEWENYTRNMSNVTYTVYARMAGFGNSPTMLFERLANPTATTSNQPLAALGTFVCPNTGGASNYTFVQLKDFFSNPVEVRFPGTTTFRCTSLADDLSYNFAYLIMVPSTNTATLRPYISQGFPYPGVTGVAPDNQISFTIANRATAVVPGSIQLYLNGTNVTPGISVSNNAAGAVVGYQPTLLLVGATNTVKAVYGDGTVTQTNQWQFTVANVQVLPSTDAVALGSGVDSGFAIHIFKITDSAPASLFTSIFTAETELSGGFDQPIGGQPYPNLAGGPNGDGRYLEPGTLNYDITGNPSGSFTFVTKKPFPNVPAAATNNFIAMEALMYLQLAPGVYTFAVRSDDGFRFTAGPTVCDTNQVIAEFVLDRANTTPSTFDMVVQASGLYPMRLLYWQGTAGGSLEFYSINRTTGAATLINDPSNPSAIKAYPALKTTLTQIGHSGNTTTFKFQTEGCRTHRVQFKNALTDALWTPLTNIIGDWSVATVTDTTASGRSRFYRVQTQ